MSNTDDLLQNAKRYKASFEKSDLPKSPGRKTAVLACMDARLNLYGILGLNEGDAHLIRNAGGAVTDDAIRSLTVSQRLLGTEEIIVVHHTDCGMRTFADEDLRRSIEEETGVKPEWAPVEFSEVEDDVRDAIALIIDSPFIPNTDSVRGFVYEVETGALREVT